MGETLGIAHNVFEKMAREKDRKERLKKYEDWQKEKVRKKQRLRDMRDKIKKAEKANEEEDNCNDEELEYEDEEELPAEDFPGEQKSTTPPPIVSTEQVVAAAKSNQTPVVNAESTNAATTFREAKSTDHPGSGGGNRAGEDGDAKSPRCGKCILL